MDHYKPCSRFWSTRSTEPKSSRPFRLDRLECARSKRCAPVWKRSSEIPMLIAHLVPGYFAAVKSRPDWKPIWSKSQRTLLWVAALGSTVLPDVDVIYNTLFRGFINHSILWTHSLIPHLIVGLGWLILRYAGSWPFLRTLVWIVAVGGLSHLVLDVIVHGTPLLYPWSLMMVGWPPTRVVKGGLWAYLTDPIFLLEPLALALVGWHWILNQNFTSRVQTVLLTMLFVIFISFIVSFLWLLPELRALVASAL
jgi:LexA-binding, inner membrane-associated putative hydrolase